MPIAFHAESGLFHLQTRSMSYMFQSLRGYPAHVYWGRKLSEAAANRLLQRAERASFSPNPVPEDRSISLDTLPQEYPGYGSSDFRNPAYAVQLPNGTTVTELLYVSHEIAPGKPSLEGLPAVYAERADEAETLTVRLEDKQSGLKAELSYTVFEAFDAVIRSARIVNAGAEAAQLTRALSFSVDLPHDRFELLQLSGSWTRERYIHKRALTPGVQAIESRRGSSSHNNNPFFALLAEGATEDHGDVYGFSLVYSGSFAGGVEVDQFHTARAYMGINPFDFSWRLEAGESFQTPEAVLVFSHEGLGAMSRTYHELYRTRLCRGAFRDAVRPILVNNWEATYFDFNADKIEAIAEAGSALGIELFVLDDGWFGRRDSDNSSLGDWVVDKKKLPNGLEDLAERVRSHGLEFGLWFEPEMVSPDSDLYRAHPDWCLHVPGRRRSEGRRQLILDLSRADVQDYIVEAVGGILRSAPITYVKWDMNRNMSEIGSALLPPNRQRETAHRYMLGLYGVLERITSTFPNVLFESCSGGGGRFDPGMLYYMPQTWTSDNSDAISRLKIQYGTSIVYPVSAMGAHVSAVPNHQVGRLTPLKTRGDVAMSGNFGYELDLTKFTDEEKEEVKRQVALVKDVRGLVQYGSFFRLLSPFEGNETTWMFVSSDKREALVVHVTVLNESHAPLGRLKLKGLDPDFRYEWLGTDEIVGGDELMYAGVAKERAHGDYHSVVYRFIAK
ncbi:alpha-galactosidase [Paenibacillus sp. MWE-103]|uniref:Alpha-galactosidase n=1 Tax=Paenibacillus artemisiicola TaxID=1172618 RepID=A0ABS3WCS7_9BACL|nr:alpha-galactosidase [Paenibacillus artemisiicola]MBO7746084.1 alpha-galactosidase [Paenibacillus artemisiicola]